MSSPSAEHPTFASLVREAIAAGAARGSLLGDGRLSMPYADLEGHLVALERFLADRGVAPGAPVALECVNSVPGALVLLCLLSRGFSVALVPAPGRSAPPQLLPRFLRHRLTVRSPLVDGRDATLERPDGFLEVAALPDFREPPPELASGRFLLRTSGSLGTPKLALYTHARLLGNALNVVERLRLRAGDRIALPVPLAHMYGLGAGFLPGLAVGASLELQEGTNLLRYAERERSFQPTVAYLTPTLCSMLTRRRGAPEHYRHVVVAGDRLKPESFQETEARFRRVVNLYGSTELGVISAADPEEEGSPREATAGRPAPGVELRLAPHEDGEGGPGGAGEIYCRHPYGFDGYVDADGLPWAGESPLRDGWYHTRDLGRLHAGGLLEVLGRADHSVNRDGRLVLLAEVERAMERVPGVERAAAVVEGESRRGRRILAFCTPREGATLDGARVRGACFDVLPPYAIPDEVRILSALPLLPSGKLDRRALLSHYERERPT